jgi:8-oxo-dGTP diphosphatase
MASVTRKPVAAVAAVMVRDGKLLLIKRGVEPSKGKWSVPGGRVEWGETLIEAVKREVREETGLEIEVGQVAGVYDLVVQDSRFNVRGSTNEARTGPQVTHHSSPITHHYVIIDYYATPIGGDLTPGDDAADARWVPLEDLDSYELTEHLRERLGEMVDLSDIALAKSDG